MLRKLSRYATEVDLLEIRWLPEKTPLGIQYWELTICLFFDANSENLLYDSLKIFFVLYIFLTLFTFQIWKLTGSTTVG